MVLYVQFFFKSLKTSGLLYAVLKRPESVAVERDSSIRCRVEGSNAVSVATHISTGGEGVDAASSYEALSDSTDQHAKRCARGA